MVGGSMKCCGFFTLEHTSLVVCEGSALGCGKVVITMFSYTQWTRQPFPACLTSLQG